MAVNIPRYQARVSKSNLDAAIDSAFEKLGIAEATIHQKEAVSNFVVGNDVLVCIPTGEGKSFCFSTIPLVFDILFNTESIAIVISPLKALIKDQVTRFNSLGLRAASVLEGKDKTLAEWMPIKTS